MFLAANSFYEDPIVLFLTGLSLLILFFWYFATEIERRKRNIGTVLLLGICGLCVLAVIPPKERLKGGIDIIGGVEFLLRVQQREGSDGQLMPLTAQQVEQARRVIEQRVDGLGTANALIISQGEDQILVQMPDPENAAEVERTLQQVAKLELRVIEPGYRAYEYKPRSSDGTELKEYLLLGRVALGGSDVAAANPSQARSDAVDIVLSSEGGDKMIALTQNMTPGRDRIAIVLDGEVLSAPLVNKVPLSQRFIIEGLTDPGEPQNLSSALMNPLENPLIIESSSKVTATYGKAIISQGVWASVLGLAITFVFVLVYYRTGGIIALFGLLVNGVILFGVMAMFGFTFTLAGIAGIILTIGMAVDANVLIYERLREEMDHGKSLKNAIAAAYDKAFSAIFDSNITSLITAVVLLWMGSSSLKGFAITLIIGLVASMFSAILVTRVLFRWGVDTGMLRRLSFLNLIRATKFDFLAQRRKSAIASWILIALSFGGFVIHRSDALGVDFTGGTMIGFQIGKEKSVSLDQVQQALAELTLKRAAYPQEVGNPITGSNISIRADSEDADRIVSKLQESIPVLGETNEDGTFRIPPDLTVVSPVLGAAFLTEALIALLLGLIGIFIYVTVRFEFSFALGAFVALLHDIVIAVGLIVLFGGELSNIHVGAILAVAGYSINDTIVVFDRIRETLLIRGGSIKEIMNEAINATLSRTILTSATTIVTLSILSLYGGEALREFSVMILAGLVIGTYSSVFIASPVVYWWSRRKGGDLRKDVLAASVTSDIIPASE
jgi:SecD/SecF fusion protein